MAEAGGTSEERVPRGWLATELRARVASAVVLAALVLLATYFGGPLFTLVWLVAGIAVVWEWTTIARVEPCVALKAALTAGLVAVALTPLEGALIGGGLALAAALVFGATARDRLWAAAAFTGAVVLVVVPPAVRGHPALGLVGVLWMFAVVWITDITAYFTGRRLGGPKLWPQVSPKKTWSGFAGGLAAGTAAGVAVPLMAAQGGWTLPLSVPALVLLSMAASVVGQAGDLAESAFKRYFGVKDSGRIIPGHGGAMDRLDAFWAVSCLTGLLLLVARFGR